MISSITTVLIRVLSAWFIFHALEYAFLMLPQLFAAKEQGIDNASYIPVYIGVFFITAFIGILAWKNAPKLAQFTCKGIEAAEEDIAAPQATEIIHAGAFLIGLYWFIQWLRGLPYIYEKWGQSYDLYNFNNIESALLLIISLTLMLGARGPARIWRWLRKAE